MNPTSKTETAGQTPDATTPEASEAVPAEDRAAQPADVVEDRAAEPQDKAAEPQDKAVQPQDGAAEAPYAPAADESEDVIDLGDLGDDEDDEDDGAARTSSGLGAAAAAIVSGALGLVALTGSWTSRVGAERETVVGQLHLSQSSTVKQQITEGYGDGWHVTAFINGSVGLVALIIAAVVLLLPQRANWPSWVRPLAVAGVVLGAIGLLVGIGMYFDLFASLPTAPATPPAPTAP
jgi:hypothetical protein